MILIDTNLLIYAVNQGSSRHAEAKAWLETQLSDSQVILPWVALVGFIRVSTNYRAIENPLSVEQALDVVDAWLRSPNVACIEPGASHWATLSRLLLRSGAGGNLTNDAHLAAIAIEHGALLCSADNDFRRFEGVQYCNPFEENSVREPMLAYGNS